MTPQLALKIVMNVGHHLTKLNSIVSLLDSDFDMISEVMDRCNLVVILVKTTTILNSWINRNDCGNRLMGRSSNSSFEAYER